VIVKSWILHNDQTVGLHVWSILRWSILSSGDMQYVVIFVRKNK
jgi:hypothetical protein